jgi:hypothetical protein
MELLLGSLDHFKEWAKRHTKKEWFLKSTIVYKDDRVFLKCNCCPYEIPTRFNGKYWSVGHYPGHLMESIQCNSIRGRENTICMDSSDNSQASYTFNFIKNVT